MHKVYLAFQLNPAKDACGRNVDGLLAKKPFYMPIMPVGTMIRIEGFADYQEIEYYTVEPDGSINAWFNDPDMKLTTNDSDWLERVGFTLSSTRGQIY